MYLYIPLYTHQLSILPPTHSPNHPFIYHPSIHPLTHEPTHSSVTCLSVYHPSIIHPSTYPFRYLIIHQSFTLLPLHLSSHPFIYHKSTYQSIHSSIHQLPIHLTAYPPNNPSIYLFIHHTFREHPQVLRWGMPGGSTCP